jgi:hypothetical protein
MLAMLAGAVIALLLLLLGWWTWRMLLMFGALLRRPWQRRARLPARLRGLRLSRSRALARREARREGARAAAMAEELQRLRVELRIARAQRDDALARAVRADRQAPRRGAGDDLFQQAKREFARRFHPDRLPHGTRDRALRIALFRDYWEVLRRIERGR